MKSLKIKLPLTIVLFYKKKLDRHPIKQTKVYFKKGKKIISKNRNIFLKKNSFQICWMIFFYLLIIKIFLKTVKNPLLYLNFCGISCCSVGRTSGRDRVKKFLQEWLKDHSSVMISVSLRPHGFEEVVDGVLTNYGMIKQFENIEEVSKRSSFVIAEIFPVSSNTEFAKFFFFS